MKEKLYTIPVNDAMTAGDECPLCNAYRDLTHNALDFVLGHGASYMESNIREQTDAAGFCNRHLKMMYDYGNSLGNALILNTHLSAVRKKLAYEMDHYKPNGGLFGKSEQSNVEQYLNSVEDSCFVCNYVNQVYDRYLATFFHLYKSDPEFADKIKNSKGFCLTHLRDLLAAAGKNLNKKELEAFTTLLFAVEKENLDRVQEDISWFCDKFNHTNKDADWKNSKDAIPRTMQKIAGGYPSDDPYKRS